MRSINFSNARAKSAATPSTAFVPGGWGDRILFGYMFRVISAVAAVVAPVFVIICWGALNGWQLTNTMLGFFGGAVAVIISIGEAMRLGVYESRLGLVKWYPKLDDYSGITNEFLESYGHAPLSYRLMKRAIDIIFSLVVMFAISAALLVIMLLIRFDSPGPVLFKERRIGFNGKEFLLYKFRTRSLTDGSITKAGRFLRVTSMDELPIFFNVLKGEMSIVGPRPVLHQIPPLSERGEVVENVAFEILRYTKPGVTGLRSIKGYHPNSVFEYIVRRSIRQDLRIFWETFYLTIHWRDE